MYLHVQHGCHNKEPFSEGKATDLEPKLCVSRVIILSHLSVPVTCYGVTFTLSLPCTVLTDVLCDGGGPSLL